MPHDQTPTASMPPNFVAPSDWLVRHAHLLPAGAGALDVACGRGRHVRWLAARGFSVTALDCDREALTSLADLAPAVGVCVADIEGDPWPLGEQRFDIVLVTNYLHRPLWQTLVSAVAPGGFFIYETFAVGNERYGKPSRPDFLLRPGELLEVVAGQLQVIAFAEGYVDQPKPAMTQRIIAVNS
jgi:SAM-dependent methyltransferase